MSRAYSGTDVSAVRSQEHIRALLRKCSAEGMQFHESFNERVVRVTFGIRIEEHPYVVSIQARIPEAERYQKRGRGMCEISEGAFQAAQERNERSSWRALFFAIKSRLESVDYGIETFEQAFLAHIVVGKNGKTIGDSLIPQLQTGALLLTDGKK